MIANLITTILLALGVATGSYQSESSDAFNHGKINIQETKPINKANTQLNNRLLPAAVAQTSNRDLPYVDNIKYYMGESYQNGNPNYNTGYYNLYNTTYQYALEIDSTHTEIHLLTLIKLNTYYNFVNETTEINQYVSTSQMNAAQVKVTSYIWYPTNDISEYIDLSLTNSIQDTLNTWWQTSYNETQNKTSIIRYNQTGTDIRTPDYSTNATINGLQAENTYYICICEKAEITGPNNPDQIMGFIAPNYYNISGIAILPDVTQEIVDIPGLMFTILTLPFAWYSTAFNLTIFPNTPYQLNFGNLILTIVAALILLYLIRKVIK